MFKDQNSSLAQSNATFGSTNDNNNNNNRTDVFDESARNNSNETSNPSITLSKLTGEIFA